MKIDLEKPLPKYLQLRDILKRYFRDEQYEVHQRIPSEGEIMTRFKVSRNTVRRALDDLVQAGMIYKKKGSGSFFAEAPVHSQQTSNLIGLIMPVTSYIYPQIIQTITAIAHQKDYNVVLGNSHTDPEQERVWVEQLLKRKIDGLLFEPAGGVQDFQQTKTYALLKEIEIPVVFMSWVFDDPDISYVSLDDIEGGFRATSYLINAGHTRIAYVYPRDHAPALHRYQGYRQALEVHGLTYDRSLDCSSTIFEWNTADYAYLLTKELLASPHKRPTAIFYFNDDGAFRGYAAIRDAGLNIPDDISVMGYDDADLAVRTEVPLTTVIHPKYRIGKWATDILFEQIERKDRQIPWQMLIHPTPAIRDSVKILSTR